MAVNRKIAVVSRDEASEKPRVRGYCLCVLLVILLGACAFRRRGPTLIRRSSNAGFWAIGNADVKVRAAIRFWVKSALLVCPLDDRRSALPGVLVPRAAAWAAAVCQNRDLYCLRLDKGHLPALRYPSR
jgi:hypothetical protein